jgi:hypothetical protein
VTQEATEALKAAADVIECMHQSLKTWQEHHEKRDADEPSLADQEAVDCYAHVAAGLSMIAGRLREGDLAAAATEAVHFGQECPTDDV